MKIFFLFLLLISCDPPAKKISPTAEKYLEEVLKILESNSVNRNKINWITFRKNVFKNASQAKSIEDTYPAVEYAIAALGDKHSYFASAKPQINENEKEPPIYEEITVPKDIGYIHIPWFIGDEKQIITYQNNIQQKIKRLDKPTLKGWIVDLRGNFGGNMWPMLAGVGPLLNGDTIGYFVDPDEKLSVWRYTKGKAMNEGSIRTEVKDYYELKKKNPVIAVLTDSITASSGEAVAVAFKKRISTKSFGGSTRGVSSGNEPFYLSDGSHILLTTTIFADRKLTKYGSAIEPDIKISNNVELINQAINWIYQNKN